MTDTDIVQRLRDPKCSDDHYVLRLGGADEIEYLRQQATWQPITDEQKEGLTMDIVYAGSRIPDCWYSVLEECWHDAEGNYIPDNEVTHYMFPPSPPEKEPS